MEQLVLDSYLILKMLTWNDEHEQYLRDLRTTCEDLAKSHRLAFRRLKHKQRFFRIPAIIIGTISGSASFGTNTFPAFMKHYVPIVVGGISLSIAIIQSLEAYLKIGERMSGHYTATHDFNKLAEDIHIELSQTVEERSAKGINFVRSCYERWEKVVGLAPYLSQCEDTIIQTRRRSMSEGLPMHIEKP